MTINTNAIRPLLSPRLTDTVSAPWVSGLCLQCDDVVLTSSGARLRLRDRATFSFEPALCPVLMAGYMFGEFFLISVDLYLRATFRLDLPLCGTGTQTDLDYEPGPLDHASLSRKANFLPHLRRLRGQQL